MKYYPVSEIIEAITFDEFVEYGRTQTTQRHGPSSMPWSFTYKGFAVTHETDDHYLVGAANFRRGDMLVTLPSGQIRVYSEDMIRNLFLPVENTSGLVAKLDEASAPLGNLAMFMGLHGMTWNHVVSETISHIEKLRKDLSDATDRNTRITEQGMRLRAERHKLQEDVDRLNAALLAQTKTYFARIAELEVENEKLAADTPPPVYHELHFLRDGKWKTKKQIALEKLERWDLGAGGDCHGGYWMEREKDPKGEWVRLEDVEQMLAADIPPTVEPEEVETPDGGTIVVSYRKTDFEQHPSPELTPLSSADEPLFVPEGSITGEFNPFADLASEIAPPSEEDVRRVVQWLLDLSKHVSA